MSTRFLQNSRIMSFKNIPLLQRNSIRRFATKPPKAKPQSQSNPKSPKRSNLALKSYLKSNSPYKALSLFRELLRKSTASIDSFSILFTIKSCVKSCSCIEGKQIHGLIITRGFEPVIYLQTSLIDLYSIVGNLEDSHKVFDEIPDKNVVCWTALISAYVDNQRPKKALKLFTQMKMSRVNPDQVTLTVALSACADLGALDTGECIYRYICRENNVDIDLTLSNALINMYSKCGNIETAMRIFDSLNKRDVTTWTSMIVGLALNGRANEALKIFEKMEKSSKRPPNDVTFLGVLMACTHAGLVEEGQRYFRRMVEDYSLRPKLSHYGCIIDLLCKCGLLKEAYDFIRSMRVRPNAVMWRTLLGACGTTGDVFLASKARAKILELEDNWVSDDVAMSNIYAGKGMWNEKISVRDKMKQLKSRGCSWIEIGGRISEFVTGDDEHFLRNRIYAVLDNLREVIRTDEYTHRNVIC